MEDFSLYIATTDWLLHERTVIPFASAAEAIRFAAGQTAAERQNNDLWGEMEDGDPGLRIYRLDGKNCLDVACFEFQERPHRPFYPGMQGYRPKNS